MRRHPAGLAGGIADNDCVGRNVVEYDGSCADEGVLANCRAAENCRVCANACSVLYVSRRIGVTSINFGTRVDYVREHAAWSLKYVVA